MRNIISETIWEMILFCLIGAFCGMTVSQFSSNREIMGWCIIIGMIIMLSLLTLYYTFAAWKEYKREKQRENIRRGAFIR